LKEGKWKEYFFRTCIVQSECSYEKLTNDAIVDHSKAGDRLYFFRYHGNYVNGVREGMWRSYQAQRMSDPFEWELDEEVVYKKGMPEGWKKIYSGGRFLCQEYYANGKIDSVRTCFNEDGSIRSRLRFREGELHGIGENFDEKGRIVMKIEYEHNEPVDMAVYQRDGYVLKDGKPHGKFKTYDADSVLLAEGEYKNGLYDGTFRTYYPSGQVKTEEVLVAGESNGIYRYYHANGKIWTEVQIKNNKPWMVISNYSPEGKPMDKGDLKNGNGKIFRYDEKGNLIGTDVYKNGIPVE
jgi:antitoxin component YwqK of YwqJK toxin-antitoxin module